MISIDLALEVAAVVFGLAYLFFIIQEKSICWLFGIASSIFSIILFYRVALYSEAILYIYYVLIGFYGYWLWTRKTGLGQKLKITNIPAFKLMMMIFFGIVGAVSLGYFFINHTDAESPYFDAATTSFSFMASYLEAKKYLAAWIFWILINGATIFLYLSKNLSIYTVLTFIYFIFSSVGYLQWKKAMALS